MNDRPTRPPLVPPTDIPDPVTWEAFERRVATVEEHLPAVPAWRAAPDARLVGRAAPRTPAGIGALAALGLLVVVLVLAVGSMLPGRAPGTSPATSSPLGSLGDLPAASCGERAWPTTPISCAAAQASVSWGPHRIDTTRIWLTTLGEVKAVLDPPSQVTEPSPETPVWVFIFDGLWLLPDGSGSTNRWLHVVDAMRQGAGFIYIHDWATGRVPDRLVAWTMPTPPPSPPCFGCREWTGIDWRPAENPDVFAGPGNQFVSGAAPWGDGWVAVGEEYTDGRGWAAVWVSPDGLTWERVDARDVVFRGVGMDGVVSGGGHLVAWGTDRAGGEFAAAIWTSTDGRAWQRVDDPAARLSNSEIQTVTWGPQGFVAVGWSPLTSVIQPITRSSLWLSPDGAHWEQLQLATEPYADVFGRAEVSSVVATSNGYVAVGKKVVGPGHPDLFPGGTESVPAAWSSPDGRSWTASRVEGEAQECAGLRAVFVGGGGLLASGATGPCTRAKGPPAWWTSRDGRSWQHVDAPGRPLNEPFATFASDGQHVVAIVRDGAGGAVTLLSEDGSTWRELPEMSDHISGLGGFDRLSAGPNGLLAYGDASEQVGKDFDAMVWFGQPSTKP